VHLAALLLTLSVAAPAARDTTPPDTSAASDTTPPRSAPPLRVTVTRAPETLREVAGAVTVVDAAARQSAGRRVSLRDALESVPGVFVADRHNFSLGDRIVLRGAGARAQFGVRGVQVLADGIPLTLPDGQAALGNLDLGSAGRIEVLRGPASSLYGNAAGGVIQVESGPFPEAPLSPRARITAGAFGFRQEELGGGGRDGSVAWLFHGTHLLTDGFRRHAAAELWRANLVARGALGGGGELRAVLDLFQLPLAQNPGALDHAASISDPRSVRPLQVAQGTGERSGQIQGGLSLTTPFASGSTLRASAWVLGRSVWNPIPDRVIRLGRSAGGVRGLVSSRTGPLRWTAGLDAGLQVDDRREFVNLGIGAGDRAREGARLQDQTERVLQVGPFVRLEARPAASVNVSAGLRVDGYRFSVRDRILADGNDSGTRWMRHLSPSAGLTWNPLPWLGGWARLGTSFETPTTSELSNRADGRGGFDPKLGPESTVEGEVGARGQLPGGHLVWELTAFDARVSNALVPSEGAGGEVYYRNAGRLSRRGLELRLVAHPLPIARFEAAYSLQDHRYLAFATPSGDFAGDREPGVPGQRAYLSASADLPAGVRLEARGTWVDAYFVDDANVARTDAYRVVELRAEANEILGRWRVHPFLGVDNLFDERYAGSVVPNGFGGRYYEPAPGRSVYLGLELGG
jgi:iron complex outermembrane receptor protein